MLILAIILGLFSYLIYFIGLSHLLIKETVILASFVLLIPVIVFLNKVKKIYPVIFKQLSKFSKLETLIIGLLFASVLINFIGALGPELGFDALWYHLTIPKIFIRQESIFYIKDNLFYYSLLPKLAEMQYIAILLFGSEIGVKVLNFIYGLLVCIAIFLLSRNYLNRKFSLFVVLIFYTNLVIGWQSITSYVDLARSFYEVLSYYYFFNFLKKYEIRNLIFSSLLLGLAACVKIVSLIAIPAFVFLILISKSKNKAKIKHIFIILFIVTSLLLPWFIFSFINTSNPVYPLFSEHSPKEFNHNIVNPFVILNNFLQTFLFSSDPISPIYLIIIPIFIKIRRTIVSIKKVLIFFSILIIGWYLISFSGIWHATDRAGSVRFLIPYLSILSLISVFSISKLKDKFLYNLCILLILLTSTINLFYRAAANFKYIPVLFNIQSRQDFLLEYLVFSYGDFYDEDNMIAKIVKNDIVLLINMHNLYYVNFNYVLSESYRYDFILTQNTILPEKFKNAKMVYENKKTLVKLYKK